MSHRTIELINRLVNADPYIPTGDGFSDDELRSDLRTAADLLDQCRAAGFIGEDGKVRKVLGTLPLTADGCVVGLGAVLHQHTGSGHFLTITTDPETVWDEPSPYPEQGRVGAWLGGKSWYSNREAARQKGNA